ncbi:MAG: hypothetical protein ACFFD4_07535 [Candidatus Odinarchaeota archaeon]
MAKIHGKNARVFVNSFDLSGDSNRVNLTIGIDVVEVTGFGDEAKQNREGQYNWNIGQDGFWNSTDKMSDPTIQQLIGGGTKVVSVFPAGTTPGQLGYEGFGILNNYKPEAVIAGAVTFNAEYTGHARIYRTEILTAGVQTANGTSTARNLGTAGLNLGITAILQALNGSHGTCSVKIQAGTTEAGNYGDIFSFTQLTGQNVVECKNVATAPVGPWFREVHSMTAGDSFDLIISCATEE